MAQKPKIDTFSSNSLKVLDRSVEEFIDKYEYNLSLFKKDDRAILGQKYHGLICAYLKGFDIEKMTLELEERQKTIFKNFLNKIKLEKKSFIKTEYPFLIKDGLKGVPYYITGRLDALHKKDDFYTIYDWKTLNLPKNANDDLQSIVYLYSLSKMVKSEKIKMRYISIEKFEFIDVEFDNCAKYKKRIDDIVEKYYNKK